MRLWSDCSTLGTIPSHPRRTSPRILAPPWGGQWGLGMVKLGAAAQDPVPLPSTNGADATLAA